MTKLALSGGNPVLEPSLNWRTMWPPLSETTAEALQALYYSRQWTAFDGAEATFAQAFAAHHGAKYGVFTVKFDIANGKVKSITTKQNEFVEFDPYVFTKK